MFYRKLTLILFIFLICVSFSISVEANDPRIFYQIGHLNYAGFVYNHANTEMGKVWRALEKLEIEYAMLGVEWRANKQEMLKNAIRLGNAVQLDVLGIASTTTTNMAESLIDFKDAYELSVARVNKAIEIEAQNVVVATAVGEQERAHAHYAAHYKAYSKKYSGSLTFVKRGAYPSSVDIGDPSVKCKNTKCTTVYQASVHGLKNLLTLAEGGSSGGHKGHLVTCSYKHGNAVSDGSGGYKIRYWDANNHAYNLYKLVTVDPPSYWSCPPNYSDCPHKDYHVLACPGKCGAYNVARISWLEGHHYPHKKKCEEKVKINFTNFWKLGRCYANIAGSGWYWSCTQTSDDCIYAHEHVTASASAGLSPSDGSYTVKAGATHTATVTLGNTAIYGAYLYVNGSSQWYSGSPSLTSLSMSYTFPSDASGSYTVSALVYAYNAAGTSYGSSSTYSYKVTVDSGSTPTTPTSTTPTTPSTPTYHACGIHETSVSGDHSLKSSCHQTNSDGQACTVTSFYACQSHTCVFPAKVRCGRKVNGRRVCKTDVSSEQEHYVTCPRGHAYWKCDSDAKDHHRLRTCNHRYKSSGNKCGKRWRRCKFSPEPISGTRYSIMSPKCPTDPNGNRYCSE